MKTMSYKEIKRFRFHHNRHLPSWYNWRFHIGLNSLIFVTALTIAFGRIEEFTLKDIVVSCFFFLIWAVIEYLIHRFVLHGDTFSQLRFRRQHSYFHHGYFSHQNLEIEKGQDINRTLLLPIDILAVTIINLSMSSMLSIWTGIHYGLLFFITGMLYLVLYEITHYICHSGINWKNPLFKSIVKHHRLHHAPAVMNQKNFAVILPAVDYLFNTKINRSGEK